jgi:hypothetical protein
MSARIWWAVPATVVAAAGVALAVHATPLLGSGADVPVELVIPAATSVPTPSRTPTHQPTPAATRTPSRPPSTPPSPRQVPTASVVTPDRPVVHECPEPSDDGGHHESGDG